MDFIIIIVDRKTNRKCKSVFRRSRKNLVLKRNSNSPSMLSGWSSWVNCVSFSVFSDIGKLLLCDDINDSIGNEVGCMWVTLRIYIRKIPTGRDCEKKKNKLIWKNWPVLLCKKISFLFLYGRDFKKVQCN